MQEETVLTWLHEHPSREAACRGMCEKHLVTQAFERFRLNTLPAREHSLGSSKERQNEKEHRTTCSSRLFF